MSTLDHNTEPLAGRLCPLCHFVLSKATVVLLRLVCINEVFHVCIWLFVSFFPLLSKCHYHQPSCKHLRNPAIPEGATEKHRG